MSYNYNKKLVPLSRTLRKNMTPEEKHLYYDFLKRLSLTVKRQKNLGDYIVDFYIPCKRLVIELDGSQHFEPENIIADKERDCNLRKINLQVKRYTNKEIRKNFEGVCNDLLKQIGLTWNDLKPMINKYN